MADDKAREAGVHADDISPSPARTSDFDEAYDIYKKQDAIDIDPLEAKRVLRKIDWHILPLLMFTYMMQYLDKSSINFASVYGLQTGTHLVGQQYAWLSSIFYFGYLIAQYPAGYLLQRYPMGKFIGITIFIWGVLLMTTPGCYNFAGIAINRFFLGVTEAVVNPGFVLVMAMWYQGSEQPLRLVTYYQMNGWAGIFGGLLGYAIGHITSGLPQWMYVFLIFGAVSIVFSAVFIVFMPDIPSTASFLTDQERVIAVERVAANRQGVKNHHFKTYQVWQALRDPKTWILFIMAIAAQIPNAAQSSFTSIILETFGFDALETQYMQIPGSVVQVVSLMLSGWISSRWPNMRCAVMLAGNLACVVCGAVLVGVKDSKWGRLVAVWLCSLQSVGFSLSLTMVSSNVAGYTKKTVTGAFVFVGYCVGNIIGPQTFISSEAPGYPSAYIAILIGYSVKTVMVVILYLYMWSVNKARDREAAAGGGSQLTPEEEREAIERGMQDVTEIDNKGFRYVL